LAARLAAPLDRLGDSARRVQLGRLDVRFRGGGGKEFDRLSRFLNGMMDRLRGGVAQVRDAERRATLGELARQVNHDVRNGLVPIRNVLSHLDEAHREGRDELAKAFSDRRETLSGSLAYLDTLAGQYKSVAVHGQRVAADLDRTVAGCVEALGASRPGTGIGAELRSGGQVALDPVSLRRVVENVVGNALSAAGPEGTVRVRTHPSAARDKSEHVLEVVDDGPGIPEADRARVFEPFFTTREGGTGLGLAIVRRMVSDVGGRVTLDSEVGEGTTVRVVFPAYREEVGPPDPPSAGGSLGDRVADRAALDEQETS
ncbi:MAG: HAMP domain-containing histidine kinase, partial [Gemmatimonadetes bacterium]|nr:HAMP domain-containing histidine kinase [Gemmatimonadota bacterium]